MKTTAIAILINILAFGLAIYACYSPPAQACDDGYQQPKAGDYSNGSTWDSNPKQINGGQGKKE